MKKTLGEMSLEELWALFPIFLVAPKPKWQTQYANMEKKLTDALSRYRITRVSHIGSTAIDGICAKDIVDILLEIDPAENISGVAAAAEALGFLRMSAGPNRVSLNYGYTPDGFAEDVYHLHIRFAGDNDELYFRDYMNAHADLAKAYEQLKLGLWKRYEHDRDGYTDAKGDFIRKWTQAAKREMGPRYRS